VSTGRLPNSPSSPGSAVSISFGTENFGLFETRGNYRTIELGNFYGNDIGNDINNHKTEVLGVETISPDMVLSQ
jgi:hypothetical protein